MDSKPHPLTIKIAFLDVGQGDTIVVSSSETREAIVVDCTNADAVLDYLEQEQIKYLRGIIITHLHADHYSEVDYLLYRYNLVPGLNECERLGFSTIIDKRNTAKLIQDDDMHSLSYNNTFQIGRNSKHNPLENLIRWCKNDKARYIIPQVQGKPVPLPFNGMLAKNIHLIHPFAIDVPHLEFKGLNNTSVVLRVSGIDSSALLTGDLEPVGWHELQANYPDLQSNILKFPHHSGAWKNEDVDNLLNDVNPSTVIISVGSEGYERYNHPNPSVFAALYNRPHIRVLCTQVTNQCQRLVLNKRDDVIDQHNIQASRNSYKVIGSRSGCPCAGTIIVELADEARVLQPEIKFHQESIIKSNFKNRQCNIQAVSPKQTVNKKNEGTVIDPLEDI